MPHKTLEARRKYSRTYKQRGNWRRQERLRLLNLFGGKCVHCGFSTLAALDFDHIHNDGNLTRGRGSGILYQVKRDPQRFQVLCKNCNWLKELQRRQDAKCQQKAA